MLTTEEKLKRAIIVAEYWMMLGEELLNQVPQWEKVIEQLTDQVARQKMLIEFYESRLK